MTLCRREIKPANEKQSITLITLEDQTKKLKDNKL